MTTAPSYHFYYAVRGNHDPLDMASAFHNWHPRQKVEPPCTRQSLLAMLPTGRAMDNQSNPQYEPQGTFRVPKPITNLKTVNLIWE